MTVDNVSRIMEKVEPKERQRVLKEILSSSTIFDSIQSSEKYSTALEVEAAAVDIYINCCPESSWVHLAKTLYRLHQVDAVEEVRSYLPPRGKAHFEIHTVFLHVVSALLLGILGFWDVVSVCICTQCAWGWCVVSHHPHSMCGMCVNQVLSTDA